MERYGLDVNRHLYREMVDLIERNKGVLIRRESSRISIWFIYLEGKLAGTKLKVVYDSKRNTLVTALPMEGPTIFNKEEICDES